MTRPGQRPLATALGLALVLGTVSAGALDPVSVNAAEPTSPRSVHAEMAAEHASEPMSFEPGATPAVLDVAAMDRPSVAGASGGSSGSLPNGLAGEVFGYLPYWAVTDALLPSMNYDLLSTIAYFGLAARADGTLQKSGSQWSAWTSSRMTDVINAAHAEGVNVVLTVTMMAWSGDYSSMSALLNSPTNRARLAADIAATVAARNADGVNLDFEPMPNSLEAAYTAFVRDVRAALGDAYLTVAVTGGAATWDEGYDLAGLTAPGAADALMVMGYDLNWSGSRHAGGVAPIVSPYSIDVDTAMTDFLARVPGTKLIWGVPYYGRAWTTTSSTLNGETCLADGSCTAASWTFTYVNAVPAAAQHGRRWDGGGQVPWYTYRSSTYGAQVQAYYDDAASLDIKYDLVNDRGLRGIGVWHLLMDAGRQELWSTIGRNLLALSFMDIDDSIHWQAIEWLHAQGITGGCGSLRFCPTAPVRRDEMASFLDRAFALEATNVDAFTDDAGNIHEAAINRLAAAGITGGCRVNRYCPASSVGRDEMAAFLARALALPAATRDHFSDDDGNPHEAAINSLAEAGITGGCGGTRFCPSGLVLREQMASFLQRALKS